MLTEAEMKPHRERRERIAKQNEVRIAKQNAERIAKQNEMRFAKQNAVAKSAATSGSDTPCLNLGSHKEYPTLDVAAATTTSRASVRRRAHRRHRVHGQYSVE